MAKKPGHSVGTGRGVLGGSADKFARTPKEQAHGGGRQLPSNHNFYGGSKTQKLTSFGAKKVPKSKGLASWGLALRDAWHCPRRQGLMMVRGHGNLGNGFKGRARRGRMKAHLSRAMYKALHELKALQARRNGGSAPLARIDVQIP